MADTDLTEKQISFLEKYCAIDVYFFKKKAVERRDAQERAFRQFNAAADQTRKAIGVLANASSREQLLLGVAAAQAILEGKSGKSDLNGALGKLDEVNEAIDLWQLLSDCDNRRLLLSARIKEALAKVPSKAKEIAATWAKANGWAATGKKADLVTALQIYDQLDVLLAADGPVSSGGVAKADPAKLKPLQDRFAKTGTAAGAAFASAWPLFLTQARVTAQNAIAAAGQSAGEDADTLARKMTDAEAMILDYETKAARIIADHLAYDLALKAAKSALTDIKAHKQASSTPHVAPVIAMLEGVMADGAQKAADFDFRAAFLAIKDVPDRCAALFKVADDVAELAAVGALRAALVTGLKAVPAGPIFREADIAAKAARQLLAEGQAAQTAGHLSEAVAKFAAIPAAVDKARILLNRTTAFRDIYDDLDQRLGHFKAQTGEVALALAHNLAILEGRMAEAAALAGDASNPDINAANVKLAGLWDLKESLNAKTTEIKTWLIDKADFDRRLTEVQNRDGVNGRIAIEDFYQRLLIDKTRSEALVAPGASICEWAAASKIVKASAGLHARKIALADQGKTYLARYRLLDTAIKDLKAADTGTLTQALAGAEALLRNAVGQKDAKDWTGANATLAVCKAQVDGIRAVKVQADKVTAAKTDPSLATIATDFNAAYSACGRAFAAARQADTPDNVFRDLLAGATGLANQARTASLVPDPTEAERMLQAAIAQCDRVVKLAGERAAFIAVETLVKTAHATLTPLNAGNVITSELAEATGLMDRATLQNHPPGFAYGASVALIMQAQALMTKAQRKQEAFTSMVGDRAEIDTAISLLDQAASLNNPDYRSILGSELARMQTLRQEIASLLTAGKAEDAKAKVAEGKKLAAGYTTLAADADAAWRRQYFGLTKRIEALEAFATAPELDTYAKSNLADLRNLEVKCADAMFKKAFNSVVSMAYEAEWIADTATNLVTAGRAYDLIRKDSQTALKTLTDLRPLTSAQIEAQVAALEARLKSAMDQAALQNYSGASKRLATFVADCTALDTVVAAYKACGTARAAAQLALADLGKLNDQSAIEPAVARLRGQMAAATAFADQADFTAAKTEFDLLTTGCAAARKTAEDHQAFGKVIEDTHAAPSGDAAALVTQIATARRLVADQQNLPEHLFVQTELREAGFRLDEAETLTADTATCVPKIRQAMESCASARLTMGLFAQLAQTETRVQKDIADLLALPMAVFVRDALGALKVRLDKALAAVRADPAQRPAVLMEIEAVISAHLRLKRAAEDQVKHVALRDAILPELAKMDRHDQRYAMKQDIELARQMIANADKLAEQHDHAKAYALLVKARDTQEAALVKAEMAGNKEPDLAAIQKILARADGPKQLDALVATLSDVAKKKVIKVAFEARFGCKLVVTKPVFDQPGFLAELDQWKIDNADPNPSAEVEDDIRNRNTTYPEVTDPDGKGADIQRFYAAMVNLPTSDTLDNDSLLEFETTEGPNSGSFYSGAKRVTMREGEFGKSAIYGVGLEHELGAIETDCKPVPCEPITYFNWNTLHEVGHAVDDKKGFMKSQGFALAGWQDYAGNTRPIAEKVAAQYNFDAGWIAAYMSGVADPPMPEPPGGATAEEWEDRRIICQTWVDRARSTQNPWSTDASAKALTIGGVVYQESYPNSWTSYLFSKRTQGVSGYQFRAPGEWFSELYAAYHTKSLNPKHPANLWLKDL